MSLSPAKGDEDIGGITQQVFYETYYLRYNSILNIFVDTKNSDIREFCFSKFRFIQWPIVH